MELIASCIRTNSLDTCILIVFKCLKKPLQKIYLNEIKFFKSKKELLDNVNKNRYELFENVNDIKQETVKRSLNLIKNYLSGENLNLHDEFRLLNIELLLKQKFPTPFSYKVIQSLLATKYGELISYSQLGDAIGSKAYRAIGSVLKKNPLPLLIPCHRVLKKNGQIGGFMGSINNGWELELKQHLINIELARVT